MGDPTPTYQLADMLLEGKLADLVAEHRAARRSWRWIARDIYERTAHKVDVTHETVRSWFPEGDKKPPGGSEATATSHRGAA